MWIEIHPNEFAIRQAVSDAIGAVLGSIHGLPHGMSVPDAANVAVEKIMREGWQ
ncbi:hypothetical protein [Mycobacterium phage WXIN]|nr:hypothetical protein [Mycobacterium phage WXIN]